MRRSPRKKQVKMAKLLIVLALCISAVCAIPPRRHGRRIIDPTMDWRVVGGSDAKVGQFPHIVQLSDNWGQFCGGSIINPTWVLTAASCVDLAGTDFYIIAGSTKLSEDGDEYNVKRVIIHSGWSWNSLQNDIALVELASPVSYNDLVQAIPLAQKDVGADADAVLCGWGNLYLGGPVPNNLQFINLKTVSQSDCDAAHSNYPVTDLQVCTFTKVGEGICNGDYGGPLVSNGKQIGIVSWGFACALGKPDVFTSVSAFKGWIKENIGA